MQQPSSTCTGGKAGSVSSVWHLTKNNLWSCFDLEQFIGAQFPAKLENYTKDLITQKNDLQVAMVMQIAVGVDKIGMRHTFF